MKHTKQMINSQHVMSSGIDPISPKRVHREDNRELASSANKAKPMKMDIGEVIPWIRPPSRAPLVY